MDSKKLSEFIAVYLQYYIQKYGPITEEEKDRLIKALEEIYGQQ